MSELPPDARNRESGRAKYRKLDSAALWDYALKALAARAQSAAQIRQKLRSRAERAGDVEEIMARLRDYGYVNDARFAEGFATARLEDRLGKHRVLRDLRERHVAPAVAEQTVRKVYSSVDETRLVEEFIRRKYRLAARESLFQDDKDLASAFRKLLRAGFTSSVVIQVLKRFARNPDLLDALEEAPPEVEEDTPD
jgi:regulatory protein